MTPLPILQTTPASGRVARSRMASRRAWILLGVHLVFAAHIAHWLWTGASLSPLEPSEAIRFSRAGVVNAGLLFFAATIVLTAVFGRFFCGWGCHLVALQDMAAGLLARLGIRPRPLRARWMAWAPMVAFLYLFIWPLVVRMAGGDVLVRGPSELVTTEFWARFPGWPLALLTFVVCGFVAIYFLGAKGFCTYACPYGAAFAAADHLAPMRIRVNDDCESCGHCTAVCTSNVRVHEEVRDFGMVVDPGCMKCMDCVSVCPKDALRYGAGPIPLFDRATRAARRNASTSTRPMPWREELLLLVVFAVGYLSFRGLYGIVPILLALGLAAVFAFFSLIGWRLVARSHFALSGVVLKRDGRLSRAGWGAAALLLLVHAFLIHSAWIRLELERGERAFARLRPIHQAALDLARPPVTGPAASPLVATLDRYRTLERWGALPTFAAAERRATLALTLGRFDEARRAATTSIDRNERVPEALRVRAVAAAKVGKFTEASRDFVSLRGMRPHDPDLIIQSGLVLAELGRLEDAASLFAEGSRAHPDSSAMHYNLGLALSLLGRDAEAISSLQKARELDPASQATLETLAGALAQAGRFAEAEPLFAEAVRRVPEDAASQLLHGRVLLELERYGEARRALERAQSLGDETASALLADLPAVNDVP